MAAAAASTHVPRKRNRSASPAKDRKWSPSPTRPKPASVARNVEFSIVLHQHTNAAKQRMKREQLKRVFLPPFVTRALGLLGVKSNSYKTTSEVKVWTPKTDEYANTLATTVSVKLTPGEAASLEKLVDVTEIKPFAPWNDKAWLSGHSHINGVCASVKLGRHLQDNNILAVTLEFETWPANVKCRCAFTCQT